MKRLNRLLKLTRTWGIPGQDRVGRILLDHRKPQNRIQAIAWLENGDVLLQCDTDSYIEWKVLTSGSYEPEVLRLISVSLRKGDVALDVGANVGVHALTMARRVGESGRVIACEPVAELRRRLEENVLLNRLENVTLSAKALSDHHGEDQIGVPPGSWNQGSARLSGDGVMIDVTTGDQLLVECEISELQLIKVDVEGHEFAVLRGLERSIRKFRPRIIFEYDRAYWEREGYRFDECFTFLTSEGYALYEVFDFGMIGIMDAVQSDSANIFCLPKPSES